MSLEEYIDVVFTDKAGNEKNTKLLLSERDI